MHQYRADIEWTDSDNAFQSGKYSRAHVWRFDGGIEFPASASPQVVRPPLTREDAVDPEEAFVASLASCHMLTFLYVAYKAGFVIRAYRDQAVGTMAKTDAGQYWVATVRINPEIAFEGKQPSAAELAGLHEQAHRECYIANSIKTEVLIGPAAG